MMIVNDKEVLTVYTELIFVSSDWEKPLGWEFNHV
jgi:hypothetical protein